MDRIQRDLRRLPSLNAFMRLMGAKRSLRGIFHIFSRIRFGSVIVGAEAPARDYASKTSVTNCPK